MFSCLVSSESSHSKEQYETASISISVLKLQLLLFTIANHNQCSMVVQYIRDDQENCFVKVYSLYG